MDSDRKFNPGGIIGSAAGTVTVALQPGEQITRICPFCRGTYTRPWDARIDLFTTADPYPPAERIVTVDGKTIHHCRRGVQVITETDTS